MQIFVIWEDQGRIRVGHGSIYKNIMAMKASEIIQCLFNIENNGIKKSME